MTFVPSVRGGAFDGPSPIAVKDLSMASLKEARMPVQLRQGKLGEIRALGFIMRLRIDRNRDCIAEP